MVQRGGAWRAAAPPSPLLAVPNVTATDHPSTVSVPIRHCHYDGPLLCGFNVAIKGLTSATAAMAWIRHCVRDADPRGDEAEHALVGMMPSTASLTYSRQRPVEQLTTSTTDDLDGLTAWLAHRRDVGYYSTSTTCKRCLQTLTDADNLLNIV